MKSSLFSQLLRSKVLIILICFLPLVIFGVFQINRIYYEQSREELQNVCVVLKTPVLRYLSEQDQDGLQGWLNAVGMETQNMGRIRLTVIAPDGRVLADSKFSSDDMENLALRPEVEVAYSGDVGFDKRKNEVLQKELMYVAVPLYVGGSKRCYVLRASIFTQSLIQSMQEMILHLVLLSILLCFLASIISYYGALRLSKPLRMLKRAADRIARGNFSARVPLVESDEVDRVGVAMNKMMVQLSERIMTITKERNEKEQILLNMTDGIIVMDQNGTVKSLNPVASDILFVMEEDVLSQPVELVLKESVLLPFVQKSMETDLTVEDVFMFHQHLDEAKTFHVHGTPIFGGGRAREGTLIMLNDVTELRRLERLRQEFIANVSHELKTPITLIKGFAETLLDGAISSEKNARRFVTIIAHHTERIEGIIGNLMQLSRIEKEGSGVNKEKIMMNTLIENSMKAVETLAQTENVRIVWLGEDMKLYGNQRLLEQAIINFFSNAIRYSEKGGRVNVRSVQEKGMLWISVQDFGCGIEESHLPKLFRRFYRVDQSRARKEGGTGLGLAIVKHIVQSHGGRVFVNSKWGEGSTFTICLPDAFH